MTERLKLAHKNQEKEEPIVLHQRGIDILFEHRRQVKNIFLQIKGHYKIAYFGINIINPANELVSFSSLPHIEYNLIQQGLWKYDPCFCSKKLNKNVLFWWDEINANHVLIEQIKEIKLTSNQFRFGMTLSRELNGFNFLYSYATSSIEEDLKKYYSAQIFALIDIGDYFCSSILNLYSEYCGHFALPCLSQLNSKSTDTGLRSPLKLIVNNS